MSTELAVADEPRQLAEAEALNPLMLLQQAVQSGMEPAQLKALVDLQEQWRAARAKEAFARAMTEVQAEMPCIVRDAENEQTRSRYVRMETVTHQAKAIYTAHGFSLSFSEQESTIEKFKRIACLVRHNEGHSETHWIDLPLDGFSAKGTPIGAMNPVQAAISTGTYGQRVLTCRVFNITIANTDLDGNTLHPNPGENSAAPKAQPRAQREKPQTEVSEMDLAHLIDHWKGVNPEPGGDLAKQGAAYKQWVIKVCDRVFNARKVSEWTAADYRKCCSALSIPTLEELS